jgi:hypothetical protein
MVVHYRKHYRKFAAEEVVYKRDATIVPDHLTKQERDNLPLEVKKEKTDKPEPESIACSELQWEPTVFQSETVNPGDAEPSNDAMYWMPESPTAGMQLPWSQRSSLEEQYQYSQCESPKSTIESECVQQLLKETVNCHEQQFEYNCDLFDAYHRPFDMSIYSPSRYPSPISFQSPIYSPISFDSKSFPSPANSHSPSHYVMDREFIDRYGEIDRRSIKNDFYTSLE